jgi:PIN domain nuclease of toxin-antitoxin system
MISIIDTSVILAVIRNEEGAQKGFGLSQGAMMSTASVAEIITKCIEWNYPEDIALELIRSCGIQLVELDEKLAVLAGKLRRGMPKGKLSLGDRACIATAIRLDGKAVTADRVWTTLDLPCPIELIR